MKAEIFIRVDLPYTNRFEYVSRGVSEYAGKIIECNEDGSECKDMFTRRIIPISVGDRKEAMTRYAEYKKLT